MIPSNIAYFVLGFISCFVLVAIIVTHIVRKEAKKEADLVKYTLEHLQNNNNIEQEDEKQ